LHTLGKFGSYMAPVLISRLIYVILVDTTYILLVVLCCRLVKLILHYSEDIWHSNTCKSLFQLITIFWRCHEHPGRIEPRDQQLYIFCLFCLLEPGAQVGTKKPEPAKWQHIQFETIFRMVIRKYRFNKAYRRAFYFNYWSDPPTRALRSGWLAYLWAPHSFICKCDICECHVIPLGQFQCIVLWHNRAIWVS